MEVIMIACIGLASGIGAGNKDCGEGPIFLKNNLNIDELYWHKMITIDHKMDNTYELLANLNHQLAQESKFLTHNSSFFISFGGDHSCAIGTWTGVADEKKDEDLGLIWIDAHMDAHTPETSESGNIHGMPLAVLLGYGDSRLTGILSKKPKFKPENVVLIGIRSFEEKEALFLQSLNVRIHYIEEVLEKGFKSVLEDVLKDFSTRQINYCVSFDLDVVDPSHVGAVGTPVPNGIDPNDAIDAMELFVNNPPLAFELVEYNPKLDINGKTLNFVQNLLKKLVAGKLHDSFN